MRSRAAFVLGVLVLSVPAFANPPQIVLLSNSETPWARGISDDGTCVIGSIPVGPVQHAMRWRIAPNGSVQADDLGYLPGTTYGDPLAVSADGWVVVGRSSNQACYWNHGGPFELNPLPGSYWVAGFGVSADGGTISMSGSWPDLANQSYLWRNGVMSPVTPPPGYSTVDILRLSGSGRAFAGRARLSPSPSGGCRWSETDGYTMLPGIGSALVWPAALNFDGDVVAGTCGDLGSRWLVGPGGRADGPFAVTGAPASGRVVTPMSMDSTGRVIGGKFTGPPLGEAFLWTRRTGLVDLRGLLISLGTNTSSWQFQEVTGISAGGTAVSVNGTRFGAFVALMVRGLPVADPCGADLNLDGNLDFFDYTDFVDAFETAAATSDYNHDGFTDFFDYVEFVADFEHGC